MIYLVVQEAISIFMLLKYYREVTLATKLQLKLLVVTVRTKDLVGLVVLFIMMVNLIWDSGKPTFKVV